VALAELDEFAEEVAFAALLEFVPLLVVTSAS
jgi:hypothetical protein